MIYNVTVSPYQKNTVDTQLYFKQNDYGIALSIAVEDYDTSGTTAKIVFRRSDGVIREYNIVQSADGTYKYSLSADEIYSEGKVVVDLKFYKDGVRESTASFIYYVIADKTGETFASGSYSDSIAKAIEDCNNAITNIQAQANQAIADVESALLAELNIYDGYDKDTVGYASDARQLNESVPGTYAEMIKKRIGTLTSLSTTEKANLVGAVNELKDGLNSVNNNLVLVEADVDTKASLETKEKRFANSELKNGWINTVDEDWARIELKQTGNLMQIYINGVTGTANTVAFTIPADFGEAYINSENYQIISRDVTIKKDTITTDTFTFLCIGGTFNAPAYNSTNSLYKKIISFNGDSICAGLGYAGGYGKIIADRNAMTYENIAVSGATIVPNIADGSNTRHCISTTVTSMRSDADYIILEGGVNDFGIYIDDNTIMSLGEISDGYTATLDTTTFCGAFENMLKQTVSRFKGKKIGFIFVHRLFGIGWTWDTWHEKMEAMLYKWGIPFLDLEKEIPSLCMIDELKTAYTNNGDGWHPNEQGYKKYYANKIETFIRSL